MPDPVLRSSKFSENRAGSKALADCALTRFPSLGPQRVLDLGCGTGEVALTLLAERPGWSVVGIDFAAANIEVARERAVGIDVTFVGDDYLTWRAGAFDMIVADSVLHLIEAPIDQIAGKLAADLKPGGLLVATVPNRAFINRLHLLLRRFWRCLPAQADRLALGIAVRIYPNASLDMLADRIPYLRLLPQFIGTSEQHAFAAAGLVLEINEVWPSSSIAKPRHRLMTWRRAEMSHVT